MAKEFAQNCSASVKRFLQTVVIADNQPKITYGVARPLAIAAKSPPLPPGLVTVGDFAGPLEDSRSIRGDDSNLEAHEIDLMQIVNAFSKEGITCGSYLPGPSVPYEEIVETTFAAAKYADIAIIDWQLQVGDSTAAENVIKKLLDHDNDCGGRLRLILVYTGEPDLELAARKLQSTLGGLTSIAPECERLLKSNCARIRFINKPTRIDYVNDPDVVPWGLLPARAVSEFTILTSGLLKSFALESVAAIRDDTHRMLAQFDESLDGAFAGQRATCLDPNDATRLMLDIILSEFSITVDKALVENHALSFKKVSSWMASQPSLQDIECKAKYINPEDNFSTVNSIIKERLLKSGLQGVKEIKDNAKKSIFNAFHESDDASILAHKNLSVLSTLARHNGSGIKRVMSSLPILSLGQILNSVNRPSEYLLCLQPRCDSVRLNLLSSPRGFSFVEIKENPEKYDLVLPVGSEHKTFCIPYKDLMMRTIRFSHAEGSDVVTGMKDNEEWMFTDVDGDVWKWVAEVREQQVLNFLNKIVGNLTRIGLNQSEWLRLQSDK